MTRSSRKRPALVALLVALLPVAVAPAATIDFDPPSALNTDAAIDNQQDAEVQLATDGAGHWVAVWTSNKMATGPSGSERDIFVARSADDGATWTAPAALNTWAAIDRNSDNAPQIATDRAGTWVVLWSTSEKLEDLYGGGTDNDPDILVARSTDDGATWTDPVPLHPDAAEDQRFDEHPALATDTNGQWIAVWHAFGIGGGNPQTDYDIMVSRSSDGGATWTAAVPLNTDFATDTRPDDWQVRVASDEAGNWLAVWRGDDYLRGPFGDDGDIYVARSSDGGATWSANVPLNTDAATDDWDDEQPHVAADGAGNWVAIWNAIFGIKSARSSDGGVTWTDPVFALGDGSESMLDLGTDRAGTWVAVWHVFHPRYDIYASSSMDGGASWTPAEVVSNATGELQGVPVVATDRAGRWLVAYSSDDHFGGSGVDKDILVVRGTAIPDETCPPTAEGFCWAPTAERGAYLRIRNADTDASDTVMWKSSTRAGPALAPSAYALCVYDASGDLVFGARAPGGGTCGTAPCWSQSGATLKYKNRDRLPDGIESIAMRRGKDDRLKITLRAKGAHLSERSPALPMPPLDSTLRVQLREAGGACWEADYSGAAVKNQTGLFSARSN